MKKLLIGLACGLLVAASVFADSLSSTGMTTAAVTFGPGVGVTVVKSISASVDPGGEMATVTIKSRTGRREAIVATNNAVTNVYFDVTGNHITNAENVVYFHGDTGTVDYRTVIAANGVVGSNMYFTAALTEISKLNDYVYEMGDDFLIDFTGASLTNVVRSMQAMLNIAGDAIYISPGDSPVRISVGTGITDSHISATVSK